MKESNTRKINYLWILFTILFLATLLFYVLSRDKVKGKKDLGTINDKEVALEQTINTLKEVSLMLNNGAKELYYLKEFNKTKNKIIEIDKKEHNE